MNRRQKSLIINIIVVGSVTVVFMFVMIHLRAVVNRSEAIRGMQQLGETVLKYRQQAGALPAEFYLAEMREGLQGEVRLGKLQYRAQWIGIGAEPDTILAYAHQNYHSIFVGTGYVVLRLDGSVEWMAKEPFEQLLAKQQSKAEIEILHQQLKKNF